MKKNAQYIMIAFVVLAMSQACYKDELVVVQQPSTPHTCMAVRVDVNVDSLLQLNSNNPWDPDLRLDLCACDTLKLYPMNIPADLDFDRWSIDQGSEDEYHDELVLDTITVSSDLRLKFQRELGPGREHVSIEVRYAQCN